MTTITPVLRQFDYWAIAYRRTWKGSLVSSFLQPVLFLGAMGSGLGSYVNHGSRSAALGGLTYLQYLAPALLVAAAMQTAVGESTYPVMGKLKWNFVYHAMAATPLRPRDIALGQFGFVGFRVLTTCTVFLAVIAVFGTVTSPLGVLSLGAALLVGLAFAAPVTAFATRIENDGGFALIFRLLIIPMFLFSGAFFPVRQLPDGIEWLAYLTPLWHGVELSRAFASGSAGWLSVAAHAGYLLLWIVGGTWLTVRGLNRRLAS
jgi:lipooligosaccharide transport system permease protein